MVLIHKAKPLNGGVKSITVSANGSGTQGEGHARSCECTVENLGFKSWSASCSPSNNNSQNFLYGITKDGEEVLLFDLKTTNNGIFENSGEYVNYRGWCYNGDDYGIPSITMTFYL